MIILSIIFVVVCGLAYHYIRGMDEKISYGWPQWVADILGKYTWAAFTGVAHGLLQWSWPESIVYAAISTIGLCLLVGDGWSFLAVHGDRYPNVPDDYPSIRDKRRWTFLINWYEATTQREKRLYGLLWLSVRGLYILPMAIAYAIYNSSIIPFLILTAAGLLMGCVYYISGFRYDKKSIGRAEIGYGVILCTSLTLV